MKAVFIVSAAASAIYSSVWDVVIDWSLGDPYAHYPFLRDVMGYKYAWPYYIAMVLDPLLRFNWIVYAIYTEEVQYSAIFSFFVALSEVVRRGMWTIFRVENEHRTNVELFRASRDLALPYKIPSRSSSSIHQSVGSLDGQTLADSFHNPSVGTATGTPASTRTPLSRAGPSTPHPGSTPACPDLEAACMHGDAAASGAAGETARETRPPYLRRGVPYHAQPPIVQGFSHMGDQLYTAHAQDFERKNRDRLQEEDEEEDDDEDDEEDNEEDEDDEEDEGGGEEGEEGQEGGSRQHQQHERDTEGTRPGAERQRSRSYEREREGQISRARSLKRNKSNWI